MVVGEMLKGSSQPLPGNEIRQCSLFYRTWFRFLTGVQVLLFCFNLPLRNRLWGLPGFPLLQCILGALLR